jgi:hypothetical protein
MVWLLVGAVVSQLRRSTSFDKLTYLLAVSPISHLLGYLETFLSFISYLPRPKALRCFLHSVLHQECVDGKACQGHGLFLQVWTYRWDLS